MSANMLFAQQESIFSDGASKYIRRLQLMGAHGMPFEIAYSFKTFPSVFFACLVLK
jgi:hypothetical protein